MNEKKKLQPKVRFREFTGENAPDWEQRKLGEIAKDSIGGGTPKTEVVDYWDGNLPWIQSSDLLEHKLDTVEIKKKISYKGLENSAAKLVPANSIAIVTRVGVGKLAIIPFDYSTSQDILSLCYLKINKFFAAYLIYSVIQRQLKFIQGTSIKGITKSELLNFNLLLPESLSEQECIGNLLKKIDKLITLHQRKLEQLEQLKNTLLSKMFPKSGTNIPEIRFSGFTDAWKQRKLGEVVNRFDNLRIPITESSRISGSTPYYGANGIQDYVEGYTHDGEYILIAEDGANDINNYPVFRVHGKIWVNNHAHVLQTIDGIADNDYVAYALKSINIGPYLVGGSRPKLNADSLMKLEIKLPKLSEQIKIGKIFLRIDYQIENYSQKLKNLKTAKKSLLDKLFI